MTISAIANTGAELPSLASLLKINRVNAVNGQDADGDADASKIAKAGSSAQKPAAPKLIKAVLQTLNQISAQPNLQTTGQATSNSQMGDLKKSAMDFVASVLEVLAPQTAQATSKYAKPTEQLADGLSQMIGQINSGSTEFKQVTQSANKLFKGAGIASNANTLAGLLQGLQKSLIDGVDTGNLINVTA